MSLHIFEMFTMHTTENMIASILHQLIYHLIALTYLDKLSESPFKKSVVFFIFSEKELMNGSMFSLCTFLVEDFSCLRFNSAILASCRFSNRSLIFSALASILFEMQKSFGTKTRRGGN